MRNKLRVLPIIIIAVVAIHFRSIAANGNSSTPGNKTDDSEDAVMNSLPLTIAWIEKPPYVMPPGNESLFPFPEGMIRDVLNKLIFSCGRIDLKTVQANSEFEMIELLRQNKVHVAAPIFEHTGNRRYTEFLFYKLYDYPGSEFINAEYEANSVVVYAVFKSWPLVAFFLIFTAIAGVIIWALVGFDLCVKLINVGGLDTRS